MPRAVMRDDGGAGRFARATVCAAVLVAFSLVAGCSGGMSGEERASGGDTSRGAGSGETEGSRGVEDYQSGSVPVRLVVPDLEGGVTDRVARVAAGLAEARLGTKIFVENRPEDGGLAAWREVAGGEADGTQISYITEELAAPGYPDRGVGIDDFVPVAQTDSGAFAIVARADSDYAALPQLYGTLDELVEDAREEPGGIPVADAGPGSAGRVALEALQRESGASFEPVTLGERSPEEVLSREDAEAAVAPLEEVLVGVWAEELAALAVLDDERSPYLPDVPTARELGYEVDAPVWGGIAAPAGTPPEVVAQFGLAFEDAANSPQFRDALEGTGREPEYKGPEEFARFVSAPARETP